MSRHSPGCRCGDCHPGLGAFAADPVAYAAALQRVRDERPVRLVVVTMPFGEEVCDGSMICSCQSCVLERATRAAQGAGRSDPLRPRPSRHDPFRRSAA